MKDPMNMLDAETLRKIDLTTTLVTSNEWRIVKDAAERIVERAVYKFATATKADDLVGIIELQTIIKKYKYGLFSEIEQLAGITRHLEDYEKEKD